MAISMSTSKSRAARRESDGEPLAPTVSRRELLTDGSDQEFRAVVHGMLAFSARIEAVRTGFAKIVGLTGIQYTILISVGHLERMGEVSVSMVAGHLHVSGAFVTIECGKLVKQGLLTKRQNEKDRRRVCLRVAPKGAELLQRLAPTQAQVNDVLFGFLDEGRFREFRRLVDRMSTCGDEAVALLKFLGRDAP